MQSDADYATGQLIVQQGNGCATMWNIYNVDKHKHSDMHNIQGLIVQLVPLMLYRNHGCLVYFAKSC